MSTAPAIDPGAVALPDLLQPLAPYGLIDLVKNIGQVTVPERFYACFFS